MNKDINALWAKHFGGRSWGESTHGNLNRARTEIVASEDPVATLDRKFSIGWSADIVVAAAALRADLLSSDEVGEEE